MPNAFEALGLEPAFRLTASEIETAYLRRVAASHPDLMDDLAGDAADEASHLNEARAILLDDESRAGVLLEVLGGPSADQDRSLPDGFLIEIMEVRERAEDEAEVAEVRAWAKARRQQHVDRVADLLADPTPENLAATRTELNAWRYIERLLDQTGDDKQSI